MGTLKVRATRIETCALIRRIGWQTCKRVITREYHRPTHSTSPKSPLNSGHPGNFPYFTLTKPVSACFGHLAWPSGACLRCPGGLSAQRSGPARMPARLADTLLAADAPVTCPRSAVIPFRRLPPPALNPVPSASPGAASPSGGCASRTASFTAAPTSAAAPCCARNPGSVTPAHARAPLLAAPRTAASSAATAPAARASKTLGWRCATCMADDAAPAPSAVP